MELDEECSERVHLFLGGSVVFRAVELSVLSSLGEVFLSFLHVGAKTNI